MYNRICFVDIQKGKSQVVREDVHVKTVSDYGVEMVRYYGLDVKFNIQLTASGWVNDGRVSVFGLNDDTIQYYMDNIGWQDPLNRRWIRVYAGYEDTGYGCIFSGLVCACSPTVPPDVWLEMEVMSPCLYNKDWFTVDSKSGDMLDVVSQIAKKTNLSFSPGNLLVDNVVLGSQYAPGNPMSYFDHKRHFVDQYHFTLLERNGALWVVDPNSANNDPWRGKVSELKIRSGQLVGLPRFNWPNMSVSVLLYPNIYPFQKVTLEMSERFRKWWKDKVYYVNSIVHNGHFRGGNWMTTLHLCDKTRYLKNGESIETLVARADSTANMKLHEETKPR